MLDIRLELSEIDYDRCVELLLPPLVEHCAAKAAPNELDRFLARLGADAVPAARAVLEELDADGRDRMVVWLVGAHEERLRNSADRHLAELLGGPIVRIGRFAALDRAGSRLALLATRVEVDYPALLRCPAVADGVAHIGSEHEVLRGAAQLALRLGTYLPPETLERQGVALLNAGQVRQKLKEALENAVRQAGVYAVVEDVSAERSAAQAAPAADPAADAFGRRMMEALARKAAELREDM